MSCGPDEPARANRAWWDERAALHAAGGFYDLDAFRRGAGTLRPFEQAELGDVAGKRLVHLQCHLGLDTLSWARLGARVTGLDFSAPAVAAAGALAADLGIDARFVAADVFDAPRALGERYDIVYVNVGALCWLSDIPRWARVVSEILEPGGVLYVVETHPVSDMLGDDELCVAFPYFSTEPIHDTTPGSYAAPDAPTRANDAYSWIHPIGRVIASILDAGLTIERFAEHDFTVFRRWPFAEAGDDGTFRLPAGMPSVPLLYSLLARRGGPPADRDGARAG